MSFKDILFNYISAIPYILKYSVANIFYASISVITELDFNFEMHLW